MNFLSHFYLHSNPSDNSFTVGLTVPDLLGFHSNRVRVTEIFLSQAFEKSLNDHEKSCLSGMMIHLKVDKWFHRGDFFKEHTVFLKENYLKITGYEDIPHHVCHILLEILLDRHLLFRIPDLADRFYASYKSFDFEILTRVFSELKNFDTEKFMTLTTNVANSTFLNDYIYPEKIIQALERVTKRVGFPMELKPETKKIAEYIENTYDLIDKKMEGFFVTAKKVLF
jgi:hypothetical protein